jgi:hypothetical protein
LLYSSILAAVRPSNATLHANLRDSVSASERAIAVKELLIGSCSLPTLGVGIHGALQHNMRCAFLLHCDALWHSTATWGVLELRRHCYGDGCAAHMQQVPHGSSGPNTIAKVCRHRQGTVKQPFEGLRLELQKKPFPKGLKMLSRVNSGHGVQTGNPSGKVLDLYQCVTRSDSRPRTD